MEYSGQTITHKNGHIYLRDFIVFIDKQLQHVVAQVQQFFIEVLEFLFKACHHIHVIAGSRWPYSRKGANAVYSKAIQFKTIKFALVTYYSRQCSYHWGKNGYKIIGEKMDIKASQIDGPTEIPSCILTQKPFSLLYQMNVEVCQ